MRSLNIALFTYSTKPRGSVVHTLELAEALYQLGHTVCVYALDKDGSGFDRSLNCAYEAVPAQPAPDHLDDLIEQRISEFVNFLDHCSLHYDCYHAQDCISANALLSLRQQQKIPHVCRTIHHIDDFNSDYLQQCQDRSIRLPDACFCVSAYWQKQIQQRYGMHAAQIYNGVNLNRFSSTPNGREASLKQQIGLTGSPIYLTVGGIEPRKNSIRLIQAFAQVLSYSPQAQLVIAGGATLFDYQPYRDAFFAEVDRLGLAIGESLILPGVIAEVDLPVLYRTADAFVFPSLKEGWGLVILEAIASGLPVITSNRSPFTEFLQPQQVLWVEPESIETIVTALLQAVQPDQISQLQQNQQLCQQFSWQNSAKMQVAHYHTLLHP